LLTAFAVDTGEIMAAGQVATIAGLPYTALRDAVLTHPTLVEGLFHYFHPLHQFTASASQLSSLRRELS
jgi:hypothetical protein